MIGQLAYRVSQTKVSMKNFNSDLSITLIPSFQISMDSVDLSVLFGYDWSVSIQGVPDKRYR